MSAKGCLVKVSRTCMSRWLVGSSSSRMCAWLSAMLVNTTRAFCPPATKVTASMKLSLCKRVPQRLRSSAARGCKAALMWLLLGFTIDVLARLTTPPMLAQDRHARIIRALQQVCCMCRTRQLGDGLQMVVAAEAEPAQHAAHALHLVPGLRHQNRTPSAHIRRRVRQRLRTPQTAHVRPTASTSKNA